MYLVRVRVRARVRVGARVRASDVPARGHRAEVHHGLLELLHELGRLDALECDRPAALELREGELLVRPLVRDRGELVLDRELAHGRVGDVLDVLTALEQLRLEEVDELERVGADGEVLVREAHELLPVARSHRVVREHLHERQREEEVVHRLLELDVGLPMAQLLRHPNALRLEVAGGCG